MKIIVTGGGAAGFFAAIHAAVPGAQVVLLEKSNKVLAKVKVSGGGRCNVTNECSDPALLVKNYPRGGKELLGAFTRFGTTHTIDWFKSRDVKLKTEPDGRMFPVTNSSQTIIDCLLKAAHEAGVTVRMQAPVTKIAHSEREFIVTINDDEIITADKLIVATGGNPLLKNYSWLENLGHSIIPPVPSLFTFNIPVNPFRDLMGLSIPDAVVKIAGTSFSQQGPLLFTHWGISGPAVLKLSAWAARYLADKHYDFVAIINSFPDLSEQELKDALMDHINSNPLKKAATNSFRKIPSRLWEKYCSLAGISTEHRWNETGKKSINKLVQILCSLELHVNGKTTFKEEFVTCGGVSLKEVNMKTMESKILPGLFFAGEVMDIDGITGGFNFQAAWTTGYIAGTAGTP